MARYANIPVSHEVAKLAKAVALSRQMPVSALVTSLIRNEYEKHVGPLPELTTVRDRKLAICVDGESIEIAQSQAKATADALRSGGASFNLDDPSMVAISRQGAGVVIETFDPPKRITMSKSEALRLADELEILS